MALNAEDAVDPDSLLTSPTEAGIHVTISRGRYLSFGPKWQTDFLDELAVKNLKPLFQVTSGYDTGGGGR